MLGKKAKDLRANSSFELGFISFSYNTSVVAGNNAGCPHSTTILATDNKFDRPCGTFFPHFFQFDVNEVMQ